MTYRADVVRAVRPETAIDTDGWCLPVQADLAAYAVAAPALGVPALYYAEGMDLDPSRSPRAPGRRSPRPGPRTARRAGSSRRAIHSPAMGLEIGGRRGPGPYRAAPPDHPGPGARGRHLALHRLARAQRQRLRGRRGPRPCARRRRDDRLRPGPQRPHAAQPYEPCRRHADLRPAQPLLRQPRGGRGGAAALGGLPRHRRQRRRRGGRRGRGRPHLPRPARVSGDRHPRLRARGADADGGRRSHRPGRPHGRGPDLRRRAGRQRARRP